MLANTRNSSGCVMPIHSKLKHYVIAIATLQRKCECMINFFSSLVLIPSDRKSLEDSLAQLNTEHVEVLVRHSLLCAYGRLLHLRMSW